MTRINKIVMHGFKSFAKHTELKFSNRYNCVLGPNGSGKSNIMDALCFVLGKSSAKSMRAEKSSNLIYNGGKSKKSAKHGEVSIYFNNESKRFPTDEAEVKITRVVRQNGQSIYKINDKPRTRQQIKDLLSLAKIDPDGYNVILQGDIVRFVEMHPEERRSLIEEISGISVYEDKKQKALNELGKVDVKLKEAEIVLAERGTHLKELKKDRDQAVKFKGMSDRINESKASLLKINIGKKEAERNDLQDKLDQAKSELDKVNERISQLKEENLSKRKEIDGISQQIEEKGEVEQVKLNREVEASKIDLTKDHSRIENCRSEMAKIKQRRDDIAGSIKEIDNKIKELLEEKKEIEKQNSGKLKDKAELEAKIKRFKEKNKLDNAIDIEKKIEDIDKRSEDFEKEAHELREKHHELLRKKDSIEHQLNTIDDQIKKVDEIEKEYKGQIEDLKKKRDDFKESTLELNKKLNEDSSLAVQVSAAREKLSKASGELAKLQAREMTISETKLSDIAVKRILEKKDKTQGIYGTVAELGNVQSKYSMALEVAAGPRLKSIVVEDDKIAAECIKYLKDKKIGRATFLPLNKLKAEPIKQEVAGMAGSKGCHGLALSLVDYDPKFKKVFQYVFSNTLIVDDIDVARRLGIGTARMATLDGDLAEFSGVMKGGFGKKRELGFSEKEVKKDILEHEEIVADIEGSISVLEKRREDNEKRITELREKKAGLEGEIIKTEKSLHLEHSDLGVTKKEKTDLAGELKSADKTISIIQEKINEKTKEITSVKIEKQKLRSQLSELRDPALVAELSTFEEMIRQVNESVIKFDSDARNIDLQVNTIYSAEKGKAEGILKQLDKDEVDFNNELKSITEKVKEKEKILKEKEAKAHEFYSKFKELFNLRNKLDAEIQKNDSVVNNKIDESRKAEIRANTLSLKNAQAAAELAGLNQEFTQYEGVNLDLSKSEEQLKSDIGKFEKLKSEIGSVNMRALEIYDDVEKEYNSLLEKKDKLAKEQGDVMTMMQEIESKKKDLFMNTFNVITDHFKESFSNISTKGDAYLELENPENPFEAGVSIKVKISSNKYMDIRSLSGGEKTMTALAFIFAIQEHEPASFYVLDEVDAALDKHNSEKFAKLIGKYAEKAQYLIISHNDAVISQANTLYGIAMDEHGMSKVVSLKI